MRKRRITILATFFLACLSLFGCRNNTAKKYIASYLSSHRYTYYIGCWVDRHNKWMCTPFETYGMKNTISYNQIKTAQKNTAFR